MIGRSDNKINYDLLKFIPPDAANIVEMGCGTGALGLVYKQKNPMVHYVGVEGNVQAAAAATERLDKVVTANVENVNLADIIGGTKVDCLIYGEVLEHLLDPWAVLKRHADCLSEGGQILACIPNIQHWSILINLLQGQWTYQDGGLLDKTHLRFFTLESIRDMFATAGLPVFDIIPQRFEETAEFKKAQMILAPAAGALGLDAKRLAIQTGTLRYIVRAAKQPVEKRILIQAMLGETKVCSRVRISEPHDFLRTVPGVRTVEQARRADLNLARPGEGKVFIWQRTWPEDFKQQEELIKRGYLVIAEIDDDPLRWQEYHEKNNFLAFRSCHGIQTSTEPLAEYLRQFNPHVAVFPNQMAYLPPLRQYDGANPITLFFGALNREEDWQPLIQSLNNILEQFANKVQVKVIHDKLFFDALSTPYKQFIPFCPYGRYQEILHASDIAILPLLPTRFNCMKSDLKFLECAAHGVVALASPTVYDQTIQEDVTGMLYRNTEEFTSKLRQLMGDDTLRHSLASNARQWVASKRMLGQHYQQRLTWYNQLLDRYAVVNRGVYKRMGIL